MRGQGRVFRPTWTEDGQKRTGATWWLDYSVNGKRYREPANTTSTKVAAKLLRDRLGGREAGKLVGSPDKVTLHDLRVLVERQYDLDGRRSKRRIVQCWEHLEAFWGAATRTLDVTPSELDRYAVARLAAGRARQTVNTELSALRRGFKLAIEKGLLAAMPPVKLPKVHNERAGFFAEGDIAALLLELPPDVRPVVQFLHATGWRVSDALTLVWSAVDWDDQAPDGAMAPDPGPHACLRLMQAATKGGEARVFPFGQAPELRTLLLERWRVRRGPYVFHRASRRIRTFRRSWGTACRKAGLVGRLVHDLRRSFARDMRRAGVSEGEIMKLGGWRTRSMFDRYSIIAEADLAAAVAKRYGQVTAKSEGAATPPETLSSSAATTPL